MQTEFKQINATTKEVTLIVEADRVEAAYQKYLQQSAKHLDVPGFRKGKAPLSMVERMYRDKIVDHFEKDFVDEVFTEAAQEHEIHFLLYPEVKDTQWEAGSDMKIVVEIEHEPIIEFSQLEGLQVPFLPIGLDQEIDKFIQNLAQENSTVQDVDTASLEDSIEGHLSFELKGQTQTLEAHFHAGDERSEAFPEKLVGARTGDKFEAEITGDILRLIVAIPEGMNEQLDLDEAYPCSLEISAITRTVVPELDDEFAKDMDFADMQEMRAKVGEDLRIRVEHFNYSGENTAILSKLFKDNPFQLPSKTLRYIVGQELNNFRPNLHQYLQSYVLERVVRDMTSMYILEALQKQSGLEPTDEMIDTYVEHQAILKEMNPAAYREEHAKEIAHEDFRGGALNHYILRKMAATCEFVEPEPEPEPELPEGKDYEVLDEPEEHQE